MPSPHSMPEHTVLVAFCVHGEDFADAQRRLMRHLPGPDVLGLDGIDSWWIAEDERIDGSDNDSAVFVPMGTQSQAAALTDEERKAIKACEAACLNAAQHGIAQDATWALVLRGLLERMGGER